MIQIDLQPEIESRLAERAKARGITFSDYVREVLVRESQSAAGRSRDGSIAEVISSLRELRKGNTLGGLKLKDLIHEGHRY